MLTVLVISFLLFAAISYAIYRWQRDSSIIEAERVLPPTQLRGLFSETSAAEEAALLAAEEEADYSARRTALLERAAQGDHKVLPDAMASADLKLYDEVLDELTEHANSGPKLLSLISYIARTEGLSVNRKLAEKYIESWKQSPDKNSTAKMLHIAALSGVAGVYQEAVDIAAQFWRAGRVDGLTADELRQLVESEYWILPAESRTSGAGFVLKQTMARLRRELTAGIDSKS